MRWYLMASTNFEIHAPHWHGNTVLAEHMRTDVASLLPMGMVVADMVPDNPGRWLFHCHVAPHLLMGMEATYEVLPMEQAASSGWSAGQRTGRCLRHRARGHLRRTRLIAIRTMTLRLAAVG